MTSLRKKNWRAGALTGPGSGAFLTMCALAPALAALAGSAPRRPTRTPTPTLNLNLAHTLNLNLAHTLTPTPTLTLAHTLALTPTHHPPPNAPVPPLTTHHSPLTFNRDIRPILSDNCFACHGPDKNKRVAGFRLDVREEALGRGVIVPGKPEKSRLVARLFEKDAARRMPPPASHKQLTLAQKELLKRWVAEGARYEGHWAYLPPQRPAVPQLRDPRYPIRNPIDAFIRARLASEKLLPAPEADPRTLIRRVTFDLTGLPPTPEEVEQFVRESESERPKLSPRTDKTGQNRTSVASPTPDTPHPTPYTRLVDRLLASPHFGERMAIPWLDAVRYADTIGYHSDTPRNVWPYRDWVIRSFNENKPFDRFTLEQLAGDLLPDATPETRVGSAFNRLLLTTEEGGAQPRDYEARMLTDRVRAVGAAWLGQTTGCAQCHDHKFDPFTQRDFYSLGAFFADIPEPGVGRREDGMLVVTPEQERELAKLDADLTRAKEFLPQLDASQVAWETEVAGRGFALPELDAASKAADADKTRARQVVAALKKDSATRPQRDRDLVRDYFRTRAEHAFKAQLGALAAAEKARNDYYASLPKCLVSTSKERRTVRILPRGNWMDESGVVVKPALPHYLPQPKVEGRELTRLDLAKWLISPENPLTARAVMNRLWKQFFGLGISRVLADLGAQGEPPVHAELLDWLACEFMQPTASLGHDGEKERLRDRGTGITGTAPSTVTDRSAHPWDIKHVVRLLVTSATYRQASTSSPRILAADPENRKLARQSPLRLDAELVRDNALAVSGLLAPRVGGPSVKPYQPDGYWENLNFPVRTYVPDRGEDQYRRGVYTWWQRTFMHPSLLAFDAPTREECAVDRSRSNIPQQALVLLNDPTYVEAARAFAARILSECPGGLDARLRWAFQRALQRDPRPEETSVLRGLLDQHLATYRAEGGMVGALLQIGFAPVPDGIDRAELASWTHVCRVLLNLHEFITRE